MKSAAGFTAWKPDPYLFEGPSPGSTGFALWFHSVIQFSDTKSATQCSSVENELQPREMGSVRSESTTRVLLRRVDKHLWDMDMACSELAASMID